MSAEHEPIFEGKSPAVPGACAGQDLVAGCLKITVLKATFKRGQIPAGCFVNVPCCNNNACQVVAGTRALEILRDYLRDIPASEKSVITDDEPLLGVPFSG